jgi:hypothetical protein
MIVCRHFGPRQRVRPEVAGPMLNSARNPQSLTLILGVWIPDLPLRGNPE